ncbi:unnamed protein product [Phytomonas sp. Hart1]|nr:unnamed protein product [Phytomonas sp. Hart1]|eukprot:CCW66295.1 unnamed protein product [Phytomonas sp. isolate Hart1]
MIQLEGVLLFALDVVKGPYVHCGAPYNPFLGHNGDDHSTNNHHPTQTSSLSIKLSNKRSVEKEKTTDNSSFPSVRIFQDDDTDAWNEKNTAMDHTQGRNTEALFSSDAISTEATNGETTVTTATGDRGIGGLIDLFVPRSEFCHRVLWLHPAESGIFYLYYPEEIPGEHYQRKTLRYSLCFMFQVNPHWMSIGESHIQQLVKPYSMMLRNVAEKLRYAEVNYRYISRALTATNVFPSGHFADAHTGVAPPTLIVSSSNTLSNLVNEDETCVPSRSEYGNNTPMAAARLASTETTFPTTSTEHANTTGSQFLSFSSFNCPCVEGILPSQPVNATEEVVSCVVCGRNKVVPSATESTTGAVEFSVSSTLEKRVTPFRAIPEEAARSHVDGNLVEGSKKIPEDGDEITTRTTVAAGAVPQSNHEDSVPNISRFSTVTSSSGLSTRYIPPDMLYRQLYTSGASTSAFPSTATPAVTAAATLYPALNCFITPLVEHRWTPLGEFIEGLYHVLRKADLDDAGVEESYFKTIGTLEASGQKQETGVSLDREYAWDRSNTKSPSSALSTSKVVACVTAASPLRVGCDSYEPHLMGTVSEAESTEKQSDNVFVEVSDRGFSAEFNDRCTKHIERRASVLAARLRDKKVHDPKFVYLSNILGIRISRIAPLQVAETIRLDQVPVPIVSCSMAKMEIFERMDLIVHEALKLIDGCRTVAAIAFILSIKLSAQLREFYSTTVQKVASSVVKPTLPSNNKSYTYQSEPERKKSVSHGGVASNTTPGSGLDASSLNSIYTSKGSHPNLSPHVLVSVFHYAPTNESVAPAAFIPNSIPSNSLNRRKASDNSPLRSFLHSQNAPSVGNLRYPPDMLSSVLERGTKNILNPTISTSSFAASEGSMVVELPTCWKVVLDALVEALLHLQMCNFVRLLDVWSPHACYQVTERFYDILTNCKHPAREAIGSYMIQVTDQIRLAPRKKMRRLGAQKSGNKYQEKDILNPKDRTEQTETSEGFPSQTKPHGTVSGQSKKKSGSDGLSVEFRSAETHESKASSHAVETPIHPKSRDSMSSTTTTTTSSLIVKKHHDREIKKSELKPAPPFDEDGTNELPRRNSASSAITTRATTSCVPAPCTTSPSLFSLPRQYSKKVYSLITEQHVSCADPHAPTPAVGSTAANNKHDRLISGGRTRLTPGVAISPPTLSTSPFSQCASMHDQRGNVIDTPSFSHALPQANIVLSLGIGVGTEARSNRLYLTLSAASLSTHSTLRPSASISLSVSSALGEDTTPTSKYIFPASWSSNEGKFSEFLIAKSGKTGLIGGSVKEPTVGDWVDSSDGFISSTTSSDLCSDISSLSSSTVASLQAPDTVAPTSSDATNFLFAEAAIHNLHKKVTHHHEVPKLSSPPIVTPRLSRYTISHTETEISLASSAALCALGKFQHNTVEAVQLEMRWLPAWAGAFAGWATPCCWALVELAILNGWLEKVLV